MITDADYINWLANPKAKRIALVEAGARSGGAEMTHYLTTGGYATGAADTPPNQSYVPLGIRAVTTTSNLSLTSDATMTVGSVGAHNPSGALDSWFNDIFTNRPLQIYYGSPDWARADFRLVFNGVSADIGSQSRDTVALMIRDKMLRLNTAVSELKLSDVITDPVLSTLSNKDANVPIALGELFNITPVVTNPATFEFQFSIGATERVIEVRDNGIPIANDSIGWAAVTVHLDTGKFNLGVSPAGAITCDVQGDKAGGTYRNTIASLIKLLVTSYGTATERFSAVDNVDIDAANFAAFDAAHPQPVGLYLPDRTNVLNACQQLASSLGAQLVMSPTGLLQLIQIDFASLTSTFTITALHMVGQDITVASREEVVAAVKLGFCQNWTPQPGLVTTLSTTDKQDFSLDFLTSRSVDLTVQSTYRLSSDPAQVNTLLLRRVDADAEALRRRVLKSVPRTTYKFEGYAEMMQLKLGQGVTLQHSRFSLGAGALGMVVGLAPNHGTGRVTVWVMV